MTMHLQRGLTTINYGKTNYKLNAAQRKARDKALQEQRKLLKRVGINPDRRIDPHEFRTSVRTEAKPVQQEHKNIVYNHIKNKILDHRYTNIQELYGSIKHAYPDLDAKEVLKGHNHQPTGAELMVKHDKQYNNIDTIYNDFPRDAMLPQFEGETFPQAIYVEYADTLKPNFYSSFTKKIHQLTK